MTKTGKQKRTDKTPEGAGAGCCSMESLISVDERGQMILPKELRDRAEIRAGDKLAAVSWECEGKVCCICLIKAENFKGMLKQFMGPIMKGLGLK